MRREVEVVEFIGGLSGRITHGAISLAKRPRFQLISLLGTISIFLLATPAAIAETPGSLEFDGLPPPAAIALLALSAEIPSENPVEILEAVAPSPATATAVTPVVVERSAAAEPPMLEALLRLRSGTERMPPVRTTDELIAAAVALGTNPELKPKNPFRKRSRDLFRAERPVTIGNQDLIVRLRLRAKSRHAMSVEFRY